MASLTFRCRHCAMQSSLRQCRLQPRLASMTCRSASQTLTMASGSTSRRRGLQTSSTRALATPVPHPVAPGPPPKPPVPAQDAQLADDRAVARKKKQAELLERGKALRADPAKPTAVLKKRFWKDVTVKETADGLQVMLDTRPVRTPGREVLTIPASKPHLATAIALEWDLLVSAQQALKQHYIPLTSTTARALDIAAADEAGNAAIRNAIIEMCMDYLATDTLLCWAPEASFYDAAESTKHAFVPEGASLQTQAAAAMAASRLAPGKKSLRAQQEEAARPIITYLTTNIWPGADLQPTLAADSILPAPQPEATQQVIQGWLAALPPWELAGLERACLATKSVCIGARLVAEWSAALGAKGSDSSLDNNPRFTARAAADACTLEVRWQTDLWGEVDDTHDVEREDLLRQLGSVVLLVSAQT